MFDLEQSIANWRQKMLAAGLAAPVPLDELEDHLRDLIKRQQHAGLDASQAFEFAVRKIGEARPLEKEFRKVIPFGFNHHRMYNMLLASYAFYVAVFTMDMIFRLGDATGSLFEFWVGLWDIRVISGVRGYYDLMSALLYTFADLLGEGAHVWIRPGAKPLFITLNFIYLAAMVATLLARRFQLKSGPKLTRLLNWALLPALPFGTLVGLCGGWSGDVEKVDEAPKSWRRKFFAFTQTPIAEPDINFAIRLWAAILRVMCGLVVGFVGGMTLLTGIAVIPTAVWDYLGFDGAFGDPYEKGFILCSIMLLISVAKLILGFWILGCARQIFRGSHAQPTTAHYERS